ncbi:MAG TPA: ABC transporter permease [Gemmatimonadaceae bacterium]|nr:ABC transporter permease [Gemmatimonadaceae bacterium]
MGKLLTVLRREYTERVRSRWFLISTALGPVFFAAIGVLPLVLASRTRPSPDLSHIVVLDATGTDLGRRVAGELAGGIAAPESQAIVRAVTPDALARAESTATHDVMAGESGPLGYLVLDSATLAGTAARYAGRNASSLIDVKRIEDAVRQSVLALRLEGEGLEPRRIKALTDFQLDMRAERLTTRGREAGGLASALFAYLLAFLLYTMIVIYGQQILRGVMEEKTTRVAEVIVSSVSTDTLLTGKVVGVGAASLTQMLLWTAGALAMLELRRPILARFGIPNPTVPLPHISAAVAVVLVLFFVLGFILYAGLFAAVGATVSNEQDAQQASLPVMLLLILAIIFVQPILLEPTGTLARVMSWLPFSAPILMPLRMTIIQVGWGEILATLAGVAFGCAATVWLGARIYRVGLLMYGKRPTLRELGRWVRQA